MKFTRAPLALALALLALAVPVRAQSVDLKTVLGPNNTFHDPVFGVSLRLPAGWAGPNLFDPEPKIPGGK